MSFYGEDIDFAGEPRKVFVNFLIFNMKLIEQKLYYEGMVTSAIRPLRGLIDSLDGKSKKKLEPQYKKLLSYEADAQLCSREEVEKIYGEVSTYLHEAFLKEQYFARPIRPSKQKMKVPQ